MSRGFSGGFSTPPPVTQHPIHQHENRERNELGRSGADDGGVSEGQAISFSKVYHFVVVFSPERLKVKLAGIKNSKS